jgi:hypothetical protein
MQLVSGSYQEPRNLPGLFFSKLISADYNDKKHILSFPQRGCVTIGIIVIPSYGVTTNLNSLESFKFKISPPPDAESKRQNEVLDFPIFKGG